MTPMAPHRLLAGSLTLATLLLGAAPAFALSQPDGTTIPAGNGLQGLFTARGEAIDALAQASTTPETFKPSCALTFEVLQRNAGYQNSFGWYNVTGSKPSVAELHEFLTCNDGVGVVKTLDIKNDPAYLGGEVAFYQATGGCATLANYDYLFFSEPAWNPDGNAANPFIHLLIYNSTVTAKAFYFGWEDLLSGGDNDFDDLTTFVTGITCSGGGGACQTGLPGICGPGTMQCQSGVLTCVQTSQPGSEVCNGVDDDCNGPVDEGDDICPNDTVCDQGSCVPKCNNDEFPCPSDKVCSPKGLCVDSECLDTNCPAGTKCDKGQCVAPCDGVVCPHGQVCVVGACIDPCAAITCDPTQLCVAGACVDHCDCTGCAAAETCEPTGLCLPTLCVGVTCNAGEYCDASGTCIDACAGAVCPEGQICSLGQCVPGGAGGAGGAGTGGTIFADGGGNPTGTGGTGGASATSGGGGSVFQGGDDNGGCGCRVGGDPTSPWIASALTGLAALAYGLRRRRR
jgi:MYXO-CTERM domain-containing protein